MEKPETTSSKENSEDKGFEFLDDSSDDVPHMLLAPLESEEEDQWQNNQEDATGNDPEGFEFFRNDREETTEKATPLPEVTNGDIKDILVKASEFSTEQEKLSVSDKGKNNLEDTENEQMSVGEGLDQFEDPMVQLGLRENEGTYPKQELPQDQAARIIKENKARIEFLEKASHEGKLAENYKFARNYQDLANKEIKSLEKEIRDSENKLQSYKKESPSIVSEIPEYALEKKLKKDLTEDNSMSGEEPVEKINKENPDKDAEGWIEHYDGEGRSPQTKEKTEDGQDPSLQVEQNLESQERREDFLNPPIENWENLYQAIVAMGTIRGSREVFKPWDNIELVNRIRRGESPRLLTRTKGLRKAVLILLAEESGEEVGGEINPETEEVSESIQPEVVFSPRIRQPGPRNNYDEAVDAEFRQIEDEEEEEAESGVGEDIANEAREAFDNNDNQNPLEREQESKGEHWWNWFKERAKGLFTFGFWEVHQAEKVRMAGKKAEKEILQGAGYMKKEGVMEGEDIELIKTRLRESGNDVDGMTNEQLREIYQWLSEAVTERKVIANKQIEDEIVSRSIAEIEKRIVGYKKYDGEKMEMTPDKKLSPEKRAEIEQKIRGGLASIRQGQVEKDMVKFSKMVRGSLDKNWYKRYVAGGIEAALGFAGVKWLVVPAIDSYTKAKAGTAVKEAALQTKRVISAVKETASPGSSVGELGSVAKEATSGLGAAQEQVIPQVYQELGKVTAGMGGEVTEAATEATKGLQDNLWNMAKGLLKEKGLSDPTNGQIMEVTKQLATDNSVAVSKWEMAGKVVDTKMPIGMAIKIGGAALKAASLAKMAAGL